MRAVVLIATLAVVSGGGFAASDIDLDASFAEFVVQYHKPYASDPVEYARRKANFKASLARHEALNAVESAGGGLATYGVTKFADMSPSEFKAKFATPSSTLDKLMESLPKRSVRRATDTADTPLSWDWRTQAPFPLTPIKNQGQCGSCWAMAAVEVFESANVLRGQPIVQLSTQQVVSCNTGTGDDGCAGGDPYIAFNYINTTGGLMSEKGFPYVNGGGAKDTPPCKFNPAQIAVASTGMVFEQLVASGDISNEMQTELTNGTLTALVDSHVWLDYVGGIVQYHCSSDFGQKDHAIQVVGYVTNTSVPYWIIRNSWGSDWGENGFLRVAIAGNVCGVQNSVVNAALPFAM